MIATARTPSAFDRRHVLQLAAVLVVGIAIGSVGAGVSEGRPVESGSHATTASAANAPAAEATGLATTSASEQYRAPYASSHAPAASTTASEQYRAPYSSSPAPVPSTTASEQYRAQYAGGE